MTDDIVTRLREGEKWHRNGYVEVPSGFYEFLANEIERERKEAADEIERLRKELSKWATTPPNRMVCITHGEMFMCFDGYMDGVYWCDGCRND